MTLQNLRVAQRRSLVDMVPLSMPLMIRVDPTNACNFRCAYCPTGHSDLLKQVGRSKRTMDFALFEKILGDLREFPESLEKLYLYKDGEPLLNKRLPDMIAAAKAAGVSQVWTTSNGSLLNPELNQKLVDAGLDLIKLSIQGLSADAYKHIAGVQIDYEKLKEQIADLHRRAGKLHVHVKIVDTDLSTEDRERFVQEFSPIATSVHIDPLMGWSMSGVRDFQLGTKPAQGPDGKQLSGKRVCAFPFYTLSVNSDASVSVCCVDWAHETVVGDVSKQSLRSIWEGEALREFRLMQLEFRRSENRACGDCQYLETLADNIDVHASDLRARLLR